MAIGKGASLGPAQLNAKPPSERIRFPVVITQFRYFFLASSL